MNTHEMMEKSEILEAIQQEIETTDSDNNQVNDQFDDNALLYIRF